MRRPRLSSHTVPAWLAILLLGAWACSDGDDPPTGPVVTEIDGVDLSLVHHYVHTSADPDDTSVIPEITLLAPTDTPLETLERVRSVDIYFGERIATVLPEWEMVDGRGTVTFEGPPGEAPIGGGSYAGVMIFETTDDRWTFEVQPTGTDVLPPGTLEEPEVTATEVRIAWTAPSGPHDWQIALYRWVETDDDPVLELHAEGPSGTSDGSGEELEATFDVSAFEPEEAFVVRLIQEAEITTHRYELELEIPEEDDEEPDAA